MNKEDYHILQTTRGFLYQYYKSYPETRTGFNADQDLDEPSLPLLLLVHGFPATSDVWQNQVTYFHNKGFCLLVPDLLGFGGTSQPVDPEDYRPSLICQDIIDILDAEGVSDKVIAIGHGIGSTIVSRFANLHFDRFLGFGFLAVAYNVPGSMSNLDSTLRASKRSCGYELYGHIEYLGGEHDPHKLIESHIDSFHSAVFPLDPTIWVTQVAPVGALQTWLESDKRTSLPSYISHCDKDKWYKSFSNHGFLAPLCWFKSIASGMNASDDHAIPPENYRIKNPTFFGAAHHDYIYRSQLGIAVIKQYCENATIREFQAGHWLMLQIPDKVNAALLSWIMDIIMF